MGKIRKSWRVREKGGTKRLQRSGTLNGKQIQKCILQCLYGIAQPMLATLSTLSTLSMRITCFAQPMVATSSLSYTSERIDTVLRGLKILDFERNENITL